MTQYFKPFDRGQLYQGGGVLDADYGDSVHLEGLEAYFKDEIAGNRGVNNSAALVKCRCVRNQSGTTLAVGALLTWTTGKILKRVTLAAAATTSPLGCAGVVDDMLTAVVPDGALFWMVEKGPTRVIAEAGQAIIEGDWLTQSTTAGQAAEHVTATSSTDDLILGIIGRCMVAPTADGALFRANIDAKL